MPNDTMNLRKNAFEGCAHASLHWRYLKKCVKALLFVQLGQQLVLNCLNVVLGKQHLRSN